MATFDWERASREAREARKRLAEPVDVPVTVSNKRTHASRHSSAARAHQQQRSDSRPERTPQAQHRNHQSPNAPSNPPRRDKRLTNRPTDLQTKIIDALYAAARRFDRNRAPIFLRNSLREIMRMLDSLEGISKRP